MSSTQSLVEHCIIVDGAPKSLTKSQLTGIVQRHYSTANILKHHFQENKQLNQWVLWLNSSKSVTYLCDEIQMDQVHTDDETYTVSFYTCNASNIPEAWFNSEKVANSNREFVDHYQQGTLLEKDKQYQKQIAKAKLSNLPEDSDRDFLELYLEEKLGNDVAFESIELCGNGTEAIIEFQNKDVYDVLMEKQPLDMEGHKVFVELIEVQPLLQDGPKTIEVTSNKGVISEKSAGTIRMYFGNNKRSDGGKIMDFKFTAATETILITFESEEVAKAVCERKDHLYKDATLNVVLLDKELLLKRASEDTKPKTVRITNLPQEIDRDTLEVVFEDADTFGENISVEDVKLDPKTCSAVIKFAEANDVESILQKKQVDVEGQTVYIEAIKEDNQEEPCVVVVTGPVDILTEDNIKSLKMYFNNKKRSGGQDVIDCSFQNPGLAQVTFSSSMVAKRVAERTNHQFKSSRIDVKLMKHKSYTSFSEKPNKLLFSGVDEEIKDVLVLYLEDMFENLHVKAEIPGDDDSTIVLELQDSNDAQSILQRQPICIDGHYVGVSLYTYEPEKQCTIQVQGLPNIENHIDALRMYFKNTNRSGGGQIVQCEAKKDRNIALITFETEEVARSVVNRPKHELKGTVLEVMLYNKPNEGYKSRVFETTRKILIKELPVAIDKEYLELYFEDFGENEMVVEHVELDTDKSTAVVEFHDQTAVEFIMKQTPLKMKEHIVSIERYREEQIDLCTIEIHGVSDIERNLEKVLMYFKNKRRSSGGEIVSHNVDVENNIIYLTFENTEVAERVVSHDHSKQGYEVMLKTKPVSDEERPTQTIDTVKVKGVDKTVSIETLTYYFESKKRSGGGPIVDIRCSEEDENVVFITFESPEDANNVAGKPHTVQNCTVRVSLYKPPPYYDDKVLIKGLKSTKDALFLFLEATANVQPIRLDHHEEDESIVLVTLQEKPKFEKLEKACNERQLEGAWLKVSKVQVSHCIVVTNIAPKVTKDTLQYYFENKRKSGGGDVERIVLNEDDYERTCMVFFDDYKVIDDILGMNHTLGDQKLEVKRFQPVLGRPEGETEEREWRLPRFIEIKDVDIHKISFASSSSEMSKTVQDELITTYTKVVWPSDINQSVQLHCTLTKDVKHCFKIAKGWRKQAQVAFMKLIDTIVLLRIDILQDIRSKVMEFLQKIHVKDATNVAIVNKRNENHIFIVGTKAAAEVLKNDIEEGIKKVLDAAEKEKQHVTEIFSNLEPIETKMMVFQNLPKELEDKFDDLKVEIKAFKNEIHIKGLISSVRNAQIAIYDRKSSFQVQKIDDISKLALKLLQLDGTIIALNSKLKANYIQALWEPTTDGVVVCCCKPSSSSKVADIIRSFIYCERIATNIGEVPDLETEKWKRKTEEIYAKHPGKVVISLNDDQTNIQIGALTDIYTSVKEEIQSFLKTNTISSQTVSNSKELNRFLERNCRKEIEEIAQKYQKYYVKIRHMDHFRGLEIQGLQKGIQDATEQIKILLKRVQQQKHTVTKPGIAEHIMSPKGKDSIHTIEHSLSCVIAVEGEEADKHMTEKELGIRSYTTYNRTNIYVWQGDMTELDVDILVNPSDKKLGSSGGLGKKIFAKGGRLIKYECEDYINKNGILNDGDVFISSAGDLQAENIAHIKSQQWENGKNMDKILESTVFKCLQKTGNLQKRSIAIPAIGCGVNRFPVDISTTSIVNALKRTLMEYQDSSIREIYLCDMNTTNVEGFTSALRNIFGMANVVLQDSGNPAQMGARPKSVSGSRTFRNPDGQGFSHSMQGILKHDSGVIGNVAVSVIKGEIARQKVDVIVNTTSHNLDLRNGAVSISLSKAAGKELQEEVTAKFPNGLDKRTIAVTGGHKLNCQFVIHTALSNFKENNPNESVKNLQKVMRKCLEEAHHKECQSIAFPAIGTGNLGFPREVVAKEMFKVVKKFQKDFSKTSVQDVRFVIYQMDSHTLQAFKEEEIKLHGEQYSTTLVGKSGWQKAQTLGYEVVPKGSSNTNQQTSGNYTFDSVNVMIKQGDITHENTDCIVNSTNANLNLTIGKVSQTLMKKGGAELKEEIENHKTEMMRNKIVTTLAPGLSCKYIIHVEADPNDVSTTVKKCLKEADNERMNSIALPAFGTGSINLGSTASDIMTASEVAKSMIKAVKEVSKSQPKFIKEIRLVIFQHELLPEFIKAAEDAGDSKGWMGNIWKGVKNVFGIAGSSEGNGNMKLKSAQDYNSVSFIIIALSEDIIRKAIKKLENSLEKEMHTKIIDDHTIRQLEDVQVDEIQGIAHQCHVQMSMDKSKATIKLAGIVTNVMHASDKINKLLRDAERMEYLKNIAQWCFIEVSQTGEKVLQYEKDINMEIENAYKQQKDTVEYVIDGNDYIIDFALMEEYPESSPSDKVKVIRKEVVKGGTYELPAHWDDMKGGNLRVVSLLADSQEYTAIEKQFKDSAGQYTDANKQLHDYTVVKIERVQNKVLWEQYQSKKKHLEDQNPPSTINERQLWHGTSADPVDSINAHGFNRSFCGKNGEKKKYIEFSATGFNPFSDLTVMPRKIEINVEDLDMFNK
ncbi:protein mono-ADP-ribosyltransferase PARP14-like [Ruditapes philippinarum]|uniref:protein mono-ADP-ribosyltransferase PARP14-like n=1 Tax=Ruditapes philippinarum TaxID=129788 RepID=UPI00295B6B18|nr:protein mono-ADP-ribosyltransferase PARP14-like [Ruditapes philippinarum]